MAQVVWLGNNVAEFLIPKEGADPVRVGEKVTLKQAQVTHLERVGHRFALPDSPEGRAAMTEQQNSPADPALDPPQPTEGDGETPAKGKAAK